MDSSETGNRLIHETSPYLLQHAHNPVDWYPWGAEALEKARAEDKPIFLSIGYASCHWCHVMAHECFENEGIARQMNADFINIKVDREERPDIDAIYMKAVIAMTGQGGWPLSLFLTPDQRPYFGGTYFPPEPKFNRPGFPQILEQARNLYRDQKDALTSRTDTILGKLNSTVCRDDHTDISARELMGRAVDFLKEKYDESFGGFGAGMKFPEPMAHELLLRHWLRTESNDSIQMVDKTLTRMAEGGVYDQLGGGFHRYATDRQWRVPHFEKMLYDNALLAKLYLETFQATRQEVYQRIPLEIFQYIEREMTSPEGAFYSSQDADTEGEEGRYYTWTLKEVIDLLGPRPAKVFARAYGLTAAGHVARRNVLHVKDSLEQISIEEEMPIFEIHHIVKNGRKTLLEHRARRPRPGRDGKILAGWNGLMISALSAGSVVLRNDACLRAAYRCADFLWANLWREDTLYRVWKDGEARVPGFLEDYAYLLEGFMGLYEASSDAVWLERASCLAESMLDQFRDEDDGGLFMTSRRQEELIVRLKNPEDEATPSANGVAAQGLTRLGRLAGRADFLQAAQCICDAFRGGMAARPSAHPGLIAALDTLERAPLEIVLSGPREDPVYREMEEAVFRDYRPEKLVVRYEGEETVRWVPWAEGRGPVSGKPTAYVCRDMTCHPPVDSAEALERLLGRPPEIRINIFDADKKMKDMESREQSNFLNAMSDIFKYSGLKKK